MNIFKHVGIVKVLENFTKLKRNVSEWIVTLDTKQYETEKDVQELQMRISELEGQIKQMRFQHGR